MKKWNQRTRFQLVFEAMFYSAFRCNIFFLVFHIISSVKYFRVFMCRRYLFVSFFVFVIE